MFAAQLILLGCEMKRSVADELSWREVEEQLLSWEKNARHGCCFSLWLGAGRKGWKCGSEINCRQPLFPLEDCTESMYVQETLLTTDHIPLTTH